MTRKFEKAQRTVKHNIIDAVANNKRQRQVIIAATVCDGGAQTDANNWPRCGVGFMFLAFERSVERRRVISLLLFPFATEYHFDGDDNDNDNRSVRAKRRRASLLNVEARAPFAST